MVHIEQKPPTARGVLLGGSKAGRVYLALKERIDRGELPVGSVLPGELRLAEDFSVSRVTVRRALAALAEEGCVVRHVGRGSVVQPTPEGTHLSGDMATLMPQVVDLAAQTEARLLSFGYGRPSETVRQALGLGMGERVQGAVRLRLFNGTPYSHLTTHVPECIARGYSEADLATTPLFQLLERTGLSVSTAEQSVSATLASPEIAEALDLAAGSAVLRVDRVTRDDAGAGVEYLTALYRPDVYHLSMRMRLAGAGDDCQWEPVFSDPATTREAAE